MIRMTIPYFMALLFALVTSPALALHEADLHGKWRYYKMIYKGAELPPSDPDLILTFTFFPVGKDILRWTYASDTNLFCERRGEFRIEGDLLVDRVIWVHPGNGQSCAQDPDMRPGRQSKTRIQLVKGEMHLFLGLGDDTLIYVWKRSAPASQRSELGIRD